MKIHTTHNGFNINLSPLGCVVENEVVRVVVVAGVWSLDMALVATLVVALTAGAAVGVVLAVDMA